MKVLFIWPGIYLGWDVLGKGFEQSAQNIGLCLLSSILKKSGHECNLIDLRGLKSWDEFANKVCNMEFDVA